MQLRRSKASEPPFGRRSVAFFAVVFCALSGVAVWKLGIRPSAAQSVGNQVATQTAGNASNNGPGISPFLSADDDSASPVSAKDLQARIDQANVTDFYALFKAVARLGDQNAQNRLIERLVQKWAATSLDDLQNFIRAMPTNKLGKLLPLMARGVGSLPPATSVALYPLAKTFANYDLPAASQWASSMLAQDRQDLACLEVVGTLAKKDASAALALIQGLPAASATLAAGHIAINQDFAKPDDAVAMAANLAPAAKAEFLECFYHAWVFEDPAAASKYLQAHPEQITPGTLESVVGVMAGKDPKGALAWANDFDTPELRGQAVASIYNVWGSYDPAAATNDSVHYYPDNPEVAADIFARAVNLRNQREIWTSVQTIAQPQAQMYAMQGLLPRMLEMAPTDTVEQLVTALPPGLARDTAAAAMVRFYAGSNQEAAQRWLQQINNAQIKTQTVQSLPAPKGPSGP